MGRPPSCSCFCDVSESLSESSSGSGSQIELFNPDHCTNYYGGNCVGLPKRFEFDWQPTSPSVWANWSGVRVHDFVNCTQSFSRVFYQIAPWFCDLPSMPPGEDYALYEVISPMQYVDLADGNVCSGGALHSPYVSEFLFWDFERYQLRTSVSIQRIVDGLAVSFRMWVALHVESESLFSPRTPWTLATYMKELGASWDCLATHTLDYQGTSLGMCSDPCRAFFESQLPATIDVYPV